MRKRATFYLLGDWVWIAHKEGWDDFSDILALIDFNRVRMGIPSIYD